MKKILILLFAIMPTLGIAQKTYPIEETDTLKLVHLDSLIFNKINKYRTTIGQPAVEVFDMGDLRKVSYVLTDLNTSRSIYQFDHTRDPQKIFKGYNGECIFQFNTSGVMPLTDAVLNETELNYLAAKTVQAWIDSPNHNWIIGAGLIKASTVTSTITINNRNLTLVVSYHHIDAAP